MLGCGRGKGRVRLWESVLGCGKVCWGMGEVWESVLVCVGGKGRCGGCGEVLGKVREGVLGCGGDVRGSVGNVERCWERCGKGRCGERCEGGEKCWVRCWKVCWSGGEVGEMW